VEHLLLALLDNPSALETLRACVADIDDLRLLLTHFIKDNAAQVAGLDEVNTESALGSQRVIQRAIMRAQSAGDGEKSPAPAGREAPGCGQLDRARHSQAKAIDPMTPADDAKFRA
jgi:hypothetical protein